MITARIYKDKKETTTYLKVVKTSLESTNTNGNIIINTLIPGFNYINHKGKLVIPSSVI